MTGSGDIIPAGRHGFRAAAVLAVPMLVLTSCAVPSVGSGARVPETIAVYMPPVGPHGRGSILFLPAGPKKPPKPKEAQKP